MFIREEWPFPDQGILINNLIHITSDCMGVSENSVPLNPMVLLIIIPIKWLFHWEYTLFSDKPIYIIIYYTIWLGSCRREAWVPPYDDWAKQAEREAVWCLRRDGGSLGYHPRKKSQRPAIVWVLKDEFPPKPLAIFRVSWWILGGKHGETATMEAFQNQNAFIWFGQATGESCAEWYWRKKSRCSNPEKIEKCSLPL